ncbi:hypothetical protein [Pseudescherichia sp.]|uniref:hypothetical protein n=1 Tax=Pseudescherichia sp. TaxID=2055881 RepID=UPI00289C2C7F|nr:hypothetical protein [Pseudescherichia sp.]
MNRSDIERYQRESILRAGFDINRRGPGGTAQQIIRNSERRKAQAKQKEVAA